MKKLLVLALAASASAVYGASHRAVSGQQVMEAVVVQSLTCTPTSTSCGCSYGPNLPFCPPD